MATAATIPGSENMNFPSESSIHRVTEYPVVKDTLNQAYTFVHRNQITANLYTQLENISQQILNTVAPRLPLQTVDGYANAGLDFVEKKFPIVKNETRDIVEKVRKPADDAVVVARSYADGIQSRISPVTDRLSSRIAQGQKTIHSLQERLTSAVGSTVPTDAASAKASVQSTIDSIIKEVESIASYVNKSAKELPSNVQSATKPLVDGLSEGVTHIREELSKPDVPLKAKVENVVKYSADQITPLLNNFKERLTAGSKKVESEAKTAETKVNGITESS